ncbi:probable serine hydrolase isoform X2 [Portunus trituberculatus]|nr:probable serine hydrolase isoform X2 [Portunus trituberculatus]XP_045118581.1 probable serine hydrolase isoform X2 [Portunus trituberculatus]XP_045118582.1 probable serine hydrolase isoform X2 [Portunus trituberculatus]XP_045118583.1 probable serine hydrolase isoform X2 [Portunus trituberculatus]
MASTAPQNGVGGTTKAHTSNDRASTNGCTSNGHASNGHCEESRAASDTSSLEWEDFEVHIGWGTMRGKMRGSGPELVLGVHGWLDNANTFDLLCHHLPQNTRFLSLDLPGHGRSDHFPPGFFYDPRGYMAAIKKTMTAIGWQRFIYLGHSMGAVVGIMYTSVFPEDVKAFISIDIIKPWSLDPQRQPEALKKYVLQYFDNEHKASKQPLVYGEEELVKKTMEGSRSLDERGARILLQRGARRAEGGSGLVLTRDLRVKTFFIGFISMEEWIEMAKAITCPSLIVRAKDGHAYEPEEKYKVMLDAFSQSCPDFQYHEVDGKHHVHLTNVDGVANSITPFFHKLKD